MVKAYVNALMAVRMEKYSGPGSAAAEKADEPG